MSFYIQFHYGGEIRYEGPFNNKEDAEAKLLAEGFKPLGKYNEFDKGVSQSAFVISEEDYKYMTA